jgi:hypothetical protein
LSGEEKTTNVIQRHAQPIRVKLVRGARGQYRWELENAGDNADAILYTINYIDDQLRSRYLQPQTIPAKPAADKPPSPTDPHQRMDQAQKSAVEAGKKLTQGGGWPWGK